MNRNRLAVTAFFSLILILGVSSPSYGWGLTRWDQIPSSDFTLPPPPDDQASRDEIEILLQFQNERSQEQCELGRKQRTPSFDDLFSNVFFLPARQFQTLEPFMKRVSKFGERIAGYYKTRYHRRRPYGFDSRIVPCVTPPTGATSYPSSHAAVATLDACVLAKLFPRWAPQYEDLGNEAGERRLQIGVHFPSDVYAGQNLANQICQRLLQEPDFTRDLQNVRQLL